MKKLCGTVVPLVTPFTEQDTVDEVSLRRLVNHVIEGGVQGLYPCGTTGEMMYLSVEERKQVAEITVDEAAGRVPVFVHTGAWNLKDTIELSQHAEHIGADGIGVVTPSFFHLSDRGLVDFYVSVANSVSKDFPIYLYAIPQNAVNDLSVAVCEKIAKTCPNVVGIKYSYPDFRKMQELLMVNDRQFSVLSGPDYLFTPFCAAGGDGVVGANAMVIPEHFAAVWGAIQKKDYELAAKYQRRANVLINIMNAINNIAAFKVMLKEEGVIETKRVRRPLDNLTAEQEEELLKRMHKLEYKTVMQV